MRIMHLVIIKKVNEVLNMNLDKLMLGVLLPNLTTYDHDVSHFRKDEKVSDIKVFLEKHGNSLNNEVMLGYFIHLLTDNYFKEFFNTNIITYDDEKKVTGYIFNGVKKNGTLDSIIELINEDYKIYGTYLLNKGEVSKFSDDNCVSALTSFDECHVDENVLYDTIIKINMDIDKHMKNNFFKRFKKYKFKVLPRDMYDDLLDKCVISISDTLKRVSV